ncbi:hypothetical protein D3870_21815 [Noviherbaspirillum cavernae]|uniref:Uncharacterized protein n=1 Tax=Noviherbaspirillum cavernae TaxID=2320862 RepID=A0A418WWB3_9BURK|nr:hypothetical protein D3870_18530 [Noviherbaspirillum cavernae]RJF96990.1 hypothetical protein D3870_21815 [Noviherbaspirillum cavernae]
MDMQVLQVLGEPVAQINPVFQDFAGILDPPLDVKKFTAWQETIQVATFKRLSQPDPLTLWRKKDFLQFAILVIKHLDIRTILGSIELD